MDLPCALPVIPEFREAKYPGPRAARSTERPWPLGPGSRAARLAGMTAGARKVAMVLLVTSIGWTAPAWAVLPDEILKDPALEARARHISRELRCLVCQNQSIDDSNAELARDLRIIVRERLSAGDSDGEVLAFVEKRYGQFVLLRPRFGLQTLLLWLAPVLLLAGAVIVLIRRGRSQAGTPEATPLTSAEQARLDELLAPEDR